MKTSDLIYSILKIFTITLAVLMALAVILPVFVCDQFRIGGVSMSPTLKTGDHVFVNKLLMGARIYTKYDFSDPVMESFRMPGLRKIRPGDVAVFNYPEGRDRGKIEFRINYVYAKRCIGCPGDTVSIVDGYYRNSRFPDMTIGSAMMQSTLSGTPDHLLEAQGVYLPAMPFRPEYGWTIRDFGPLYVPREGGRVAIDTSSVALYSKIIEFETGRLPETRDGKVYIGGAEVSEYEFRKDYCFFGGDNVLNSRDSRYFGFVPEEYITGIATRILFSRDPYSGRIDWSPPPGYFSPGTPIPAGSTGAALYAG